MLQTMKILSLACAAFATAFLAACGDCRPAPTNAELRDSHQSAAGEAEKSFDKENPADPAQLK